MSTYLIIIEWDNNQIPETAAFENLLRANFQWVKLTELSYLIKGVNTTVEIRNFITTKLPSLSRVFVGEVKFAAAWRNMLTDSDKIKQLFEDE